VLDRSRFESLEAEIDNEVREAADQALVAEEPSVHSIRTNVYSPDVDPSSAAFEAQPHLHGAPKTMVEMVPQRSPTKMARDERITIFGEDVADASREDNLKHVKGKGGVFKATAGLQRKYGNDRVFNSPLAEASIVAAPIGMATRGLKPVARFNLRLHLACHDADSRRALRDALAFERRFQSAGSTSRAGRRLPHRWRRVSQSERPNRSSCTVPASACDAFHRPGRGRPFAHGHPLRRPGLFLEHKHLYRSPTIARKIRDRILRFPLEGAHVKEGTDVSIITYGALVHRTRWPRRSGTRRHFRRIVDLRSLSPYDWEAIAPPFAGRTASSWLMKTC